MSFHGMKIRLNRFKGTVNSVLSKKSLIVFSDSDLLLRGSGLILRGTQLIRKHESNSNGTGEK